MWGTVSTGEHPVVPPAQTVPRRGFVLRARSTSGVQAEYKRNTSRTQAGPTGVGGYPQAVSWPGPPSLLAPPTSPGSEFLQAVRGVERSTWPPGFGKRGADQQQGQEAWWSRGAKKAREGARRGDPSLPVFRGAALLRGSESRQVLATGLCQLPGQLLLQDFVHSERHNHHPGLAEKLVNFRESVGRVIKRDVKALGPPMHR